MKRFLLSLAMLLTLAGLSISPVSAHPATQSPVVRQVFIGDKPLVLHRPSTRTAPSMPTYVYCTQQTLTFFNSNVHYFSDDSSGTWHGNTYIGAYMDTLFPNIYCNQMQVGANDTLDTGCISWQGQGYLGDLSVWTTWGPVLHCTHTQYNFHSAWGSPACNNTTKLAYANNFDQNYTTDVTYEGPFYCTYE